MRVPFNDLSRASASSADLNEAFARVAGRGWFVLGPEVEAFEREFAAYCGTRHCVGVANGSDALELALRALGVQGGDEVVTVANAAMYATLAILSCGATPVYADVDDTTLTLSPVSLAAAITVKTRAIVVTHLYGRLAAMEAIERAAGKVPIVEDCAQAHGARSARGGAGALGALGCFSFYPTKNLAALGDGGAVTTSDEHLARRVRALRQYGWEQKYRVTLSGGRNSRLDELQAAILRGRLPRLDQKNARRRAIGRAYFERIRHPDIDVLAPPPGEEGVQHLAVVRSRRRDGLRGHLERHGIATDIHYPIPDHRQPITRTASRVSLAVTERAAEEVLSLPCFPELADAELAHVIEACNAWRA